MGSACFCPMRHQQGWLEGWKLGSSEGLLTCKLRLVFSSTPTCGLLPADARLLPSLVTPGNIISHWGMQIKTTMRYHYTPSRMSKIKKTCHTQGCQGCSHTTALENPWQFLWKLNIHFPYDPATQFQAIYLRAMKADVRTKIYT